MNVTVRLLGGFSQYLTRNAKEDNIEVILEKGSSVLDLVGKIGLPMNLPKNILINGRPFGELPGERFPERHRCGCHFSLCGRRIAF